MAQNKKQKPRYRPKQEKNPEYSKWQPARYGGANLPFMIPTDVKDTKFDWNAVTPYTDTGEYGVENWKVGANIAKDYMRAFPDADFNDAVGFAANMLIESGGNPSAIEGRYVGNVGKITNKQMMGPGGFGGIMLTGPRKRAFWEFVGKDPVEAGKLENQLKFMRAEQQGLIGSESGFYKQASAGRNPAESAFLVASKVERPAAKSAKFEDRMAAADSVAKYVKAMPKVQTQQKSAQKKPVQVVQKSLWQRFLDAIPSFF